MLVFKDRRFFNEYWLYQLVATIGLPIVFHRDIALAAAIHHQA